MKRRRFLCIAYAFPPINRSGTHRTLGFVRELDQLGWDATVITVSTEGEPTDDTLANNLPQNTRVIRTRWDDRILAWKRRLGLNRNQTRGTHIETLQGNIRAGTNAGKKTLRDLASRWLITPDTRTGWIPHAVRAARRELKAQPHDLIFSTSPYVSAHLAAQTITRQANLPWVADFRDPWRGNPFRDLQHPLLDRLDARMENRVLKNADAIVCCTPTMTKDLVRRHPHTARKAATILNAFDETTETAAPERPVPEHLFAMIHAGQFYGRRSPVPWLTALAIARQKDPQASESLRFVQVGSTHFEGKPLETWARELGVEDQTLVLGPQPHARTHRLIEGSDAVILACGQGPGGELQVPNKLFEYLAARKPTLALCEHHSPVPDILKRASAIAFACHPDNPEELADAMLAAANRNWPPVKRPWSGVDTFARCHRARELADLFDTLAATPARTSPAATAPARPRACASS